MSFPFWNTSMEIFELAQYIHLSAIHIEYTMKDFNSGFTLFDLESYYDRTKFRHQFPAGNFDVDTTSKKRWKTYEYISTIVEKALKFRRFNIKSTSIFQRYFIRRRKSSKTRRRYFDVEFFDCDRWETIVTNKSELAETISTVRS